ncbi:Major facilitator, sugar transporter-like, partial [Dillenia turbinata]
SCSDTEAQVMATFNDVEAGVETGTGSIHEQLLGKKEKEKVKSQSNDDGLWMVLLSTFTAVSGSFEFGSCVGFSAPTQYGIMDELRMSNSQYSIFGSILTIGAMFGAIMSGGIADFIGRKGVRIENNGDSLMIYILALKATISLRLSHSNSSVINIGHEDVISYLRSWMARHLLESVWLYFGRFLTGYGIGILSYVVPVFIAEITPEKLRGTLATTNQLLIVTGISVAYSVGAFVTWRTLALTGIIPCVILLMGLNFIPESPRWLAKVGRKKEFESALQKLRGADADIAREVAEIQEYAATIQNIPKNTIQELFHTRNVRAIFVVVTAFGASLIDKAGRRPLLMAHQLAVGYVPILTISGVLIYIGSFSLGLGAVPWLIMSEVTMRFLTIHPSEFWADVGSSHCIRRLTSARDKRPVVGGNTREHALIGTNTVILLQESEERHGLEQASVSVVKRASKEREMDVEVWKKRSS